MEDTKPEIVVVDNSNQCCEIVERLKLHCAEYNVLGFDCEWIQVYNTRKPVALLQLATHKGLCVLFRLCQFESFPPELKELLENSNIIKVGVEPSIDKFNITEDYDVNISNTLDIRHIAIIADVKPEGLPKLSKKLLSIDLKLDWQIKASNWNANELTDIQKKHAAYKAFLAIEIFKTLFNKINNSILNEINNIELLQQFFKDYDYCLNSTFTTKHFNQYISKDKKNKN